MANSYLARTVTSAESPTKITWSVWVKRCELARTQRIVSSSLSNYQTYWRFSSSDTLEIWTQDGSGNTAFGFNTNRKFRDISAWYNIVMSVDTTQSTESDRLKIWVNGVQETSFSQSDYPSQNETIGLFGSTSSVVEIGRYSGNTTEFYNGYLSHLVITPGYAYANTDFGSFDSTSGIWKFKSPTLANWGTNGVHLKFENSGNLGLDSSGNSNNYSVNGNLKQALDTPSNVHATLNSLINPNGATLANGNTHSSKSSAHATVQSTIPCGYPNAPSTAKFYWECKMEATDGRTVGLVKSNMPQISSWYNDYLGQNSGGDGVIGYYLGTYVDGTQADVAWNGTAPQVTISGGWSAGDILVNAYDASTGKYWQGKNGVWFTVGGGVGNPATGAYPLVTLNATDRTHDIFPADSSYDGRWSWNFGNGYFKTTAITSAGSNGNGSLFEYDVPSGYYALNTKNINTYG